MKPRIHFFNPGHETAILQGSAHYTPPANVRRMMRELSCFPLWYADPEDFVFTEEAPAPGFFSSLPQELGPFARLISRNELEGEGSTLPAMVAAPWGLSPHSHAFFKRLGEKGGLKLTVPEWKEAYTRLTSRRTAAECLDKIRELLPAQEMPASPRFCRTIGEIAEYMRAGEAPFVLKTPYSSSGRGLLWPAEPELTAKDCAWIEGALHKQGTVSIESALDKYRDFALEFYSDGNGQLRYEGLSVFGAGKRGAYSGNVLGSRAYLEKFFADHFGDGFRQLKEAVQEAVRQIYGFVYTGYLGVDMLVFRKKTDGTFAIHPCIEVNMRYTMGMAALRISRKFLAPGSRGEMIIAYEGRPGEACEHHHLMQETHPLRLEAGKIRAGYLSLCPVTKDTAYRAYILVS